MDREKLVGSVHQACREHSARTVLFHTVVGERLGLRDVDHKAFDFIVRRGKTTAGEIAEATGLSTGGVTGLIDRLSNAGLVARTADPADGRRVVVVPTLSPSMRRKIERLFRPLGADLDKVLEKFSSEELATVLRFLEASGEVLARSARILRDGT